MVLTSSTSDPMNKDSTARLLEHFQNSECRWHHSQPPSTLIIAAHCDDEVIGMGAQLPKLPRVKFLHVTDGSPRSLSDATRLGFVSREHYARERRKELHAALGLAGIPPGESFELGFVDQEVSFHLVELASSIAQILKELKPEVIVTHPYEGGHPDHDSTALGVHMACQLLEMENLKPPGIVEMTSYHNRGGNMAFSDFLPNGTYPTLTMRLNDAEVCFKQRLLECFRTQQTVLQWFQIGIERFRPAPQYDFSRPPHEGKLYYDLFDWGMNSVQWVNLAREALATLDEEER
jgi:N-acetylglucosamine malate deacetylase 2